MPKESKAKRLCCQTEVASGERDQCGPHHCGSILLFTTARIHWLRQMSGSQPGACENMTREDSLQGQGNPTGVDWWGAEEGAKECIGQVPNHPHLRRRGKRLPVGFSEEPNKEPTRGRTILKPSMTPYSSVSQKETFLASFWPFLPELQL